MSEPSKPGGHNDELSRSLDGLAQAVANSDGRIDDSALAPARAMTSRASDRLRMSGDHTIVALAGATGSGKSSLFNVLTDLDLAGVGVRRPTTSWALACAWGPSGAEELLEWMGVPPRHQVSRMGMLERDSQDSSLEGLILLDLPDHDSTEVAHHVEMDRLVTHSDLLIWVLDPQKYADAAIHERYIRKMAGFAAVTMVVLNQIDRIAFGEREAALADVKRLVEADGLDDVKVIGVSATRGDGIDELRRELADRVRAKGAARERLMADVSEAAQAIEAKGGRAEVPVISQQQKSQLASDLSDSAGIGYVTAAADDTARRHMVSCLQWPPFGLIARNKPQNASPTIAPTQQAAADVAVRGFVDGITRDLALPWRTSVRTRVLDDQKESVAEALDREINNSGVRLGQAPQWARVVHMVQWILFALFVAGVIGLVIWGIEVLSDTDTGLPGTGRTAGVATAGWLALAALVSGLLIDVIGRRVARSRAREWAAQADGLLQSAVDEVISTRVVQPAEAELDTYDRYRKGLLAALR